MKEIDYQVALAYNPAIERNVGIPKKRASFYDDVNNAESLEELVNRLTRVSFAQKMLRLAKRIVRGTIRRIFKRT